MKKLLFILLLPILLFASDLNFEFFTAKSNGEQITLEWKLVNEDNVDFYQVEKKLKEGNIYRPIGSRIRAIGNSNIYRYTDEDFFFKNNVELQSDNIQAYRIRVILKNNDTRFSNTTYVTHNVSSVRKTWGMLKEMFR
jgi:hypothetical protein